MAAANSFSRKASAQNTQYNICIAYSAFLCLLLAACAPGRQATPFIPPTANKNPTAAATAILLWTSTPASSETPQVLSTPTLTLLPATEAPTATPTCISDLKYLADLTIPDGEIVTGGQRIDKQWQVQNTGSCNWDSRYRLKLVGGFPPLGAAIEQALYPARTGATVTIQVFFIAPVEAGVYRSAWQAYDADGIPFGDTIYLEVVVQ